MRRTASSTPPSTPTRRFPTSNVSRRKRTASAAGFALAVFVFATSGLAFEERNLRFTGLTVEDGLSQSGVNAILQDRDGFLWFGTEDGLDRYDGYEFRTFQNDRKDPESLSHNWVLSLLEDAEGDLWVGTSGGLNRFDRASSTFTRFVHDPENPESLSHDVVRALYRDSKGELWIGTGSGLNRYRGGDVFEHFAHNPSNPASLSDNSVFVIQEDEAGFLWVGTASGLNRFDRDSRTFRHYRHSQEDPSGLPGSSVDALHVDRDGALWVGTEGGLARHDPQSDTFDVYRHDPENDESLSHDNVRTILEDSTGTLWIGTEGGLNEWVPAHDAFHRYQHDAASAGTLSDDHVISLHEDQGGVLWLGTKVGGLNKINVRTGSFAHRKVEPGGLSHAAVFAVADGGDAVWVGTFGGGLDRFDSATGRVDHFRHDPSDSGSLGDDRVMSLHVDSRGTLWVGTYSAGLNRFDPDTGRFVRFRHDPDDPTSLSHDGVKFIREDRDGVLWVGTHRGGLNRLDRETGSFVHYRHDPSNPMSLGDDVLTAFWQTDDGIIWLGTQSAGVDRFDPNEGTFAHYRHDPDDPSSLSHDAVASLLGGSDGALWVGTQGGGLNRWDGSDRHVHRGVFTRYTESDGLTNDFVYGLLEDDEKALWISTNRGLSRLDPGSGTFRNYDSTHGLQSNEFNYGAYHRGRDGTLYFGGINGFNSFRPGDIRENQHRPPVVLTKFLKLNQPVTLDRPLTDLDELTLGYQDYVVTFEFAALDYTTPSRNRYAYKLEGFDEDWNEVGAVRRATYTNLDPGTYRFRVKASNNDGVWSEDGVALAMTVEPPPWRTWWAYSAYFLVLAGAVVAQARAQQRKLEREAEYARKLEREVASRTAELAEGNEKLAMLNRKLEEASLTDSLTGLRNRRYVVEHIGQDASLVLRAHRRAEIDGRPNDAGSLVMVMVDLDGYKQINDNHGHAAGDKVLIRVREILHEACRTSDTIVRWGGDEFLVVGRTTDPHSAQTLVERIRRLVEAAEFECGATTERLTASIGYTCFPFLPSHPQRLTWDQVLSIADRAMYLVKQSGRNGWVGVLANGNTTPDDLERLSDSLEEKVRDGKVDLVTSLLERRLEWRAPSELVAR